MRAGRFWQIRAVADEADHVGQGGEVAQFEVLVAGDAELLPHRREDLGLLDSVDPQVGLHVQVQVEQVTRVAGETLDNTRTTVAMTGSAPLAVTVRQDRLRDRAGAAAGGRSRSRRSGGGRRGFWRSGAVADEADDVGQGREVAQFEVLVAGDAELLPDGREDLGLLDSVDAQVGFHVKVQIQQVTRVPGEPLDNTDHRSHDRIIRSWPG